MPGTYGLLGTGTAVRDEGMTALEQSAKEENTRQIENKQMRAQSKSSFAAAGATTGALVGMEYGSSIGPWGTVIGAVVGGLVGYASG